jgi:NitT/TauT family transport system substrate-binding protein
MTALGSRIRVTLGLSLIALWALGACSTAPPAAPAGKPAASVPGAAPPAAAPPSAPAAPAAPAAAPAAPPAAAAQPLSPLVAVKYGTAGLIGEAGVFAAIEKGYFREEGIEVEMVPFRVSAEMTAPLATGEIAFGSMGLDASLFNAVERGIPIKIVGYNAIINERDTSGSWMVRQDLIDSGRFKELSDLRGLKIVINTPGGTGSVWAERVLAKGGLTPDDVEITTLGFVDQPAAYANKGIDAGFLVEPFVSVAEGQGTASIILPSGQFFLPGLPVMNLVMSPVFAQQQPEAAKRILVAYLRGQREYHRTWVKNEGGREEYDQILTKHTPIKEPRLFARMATHDVDVNGAMDPRVMNEMQDYFVKYGTQPQKVDLGKVIDASYAEYAVSRIGRMTP